MKLDLKKYNVIGAVVIFVVLPVLFYSLGDFPKRSLLKESISVLTLLAFSLMLGQFFLARSNEAVIRLYNARHVSMTHKVIAYSAVSLFLLHPFLIVVPRYFEAGTEPLDALIVMLTTFDSLGVVLGLTAWALMLVLGLTAMFRVRLIKRFPIKYRNWRKFHGYLTVTFIGVAIWHAIELGRHTEKLMATFMIVLAAAGTTLLFRMYLLTAKNPVEAN